MPNVKVFPLQTRDCGAEAVRHYLALTGDPERGLEPIPYEIGGGVVPLRFDFHALRGQFATALARSGVSLAAARELMRHSSVDLTAKFYTHLSLEDRREAIDKLPEIDTAALQALAATGTEGQKKTDQILPNSAPFNDISANFNELEGSAKGGGADPANSLPSTKSPGKPVFSGAGLPSSASSSSSMPPGHRFTSGCNPSGADSS